LGVVLKDVVLQDQDTGEARRVRVTVDEAKELEHSNQGRAISILGTLCRKGSQIRHWPVLGAGNNVERASGVANGGQAS